MTTSMCGDMRNLPPSVIKRRRKAVSFSSGRAHSVTMNALVRRLLSSNPLSHCPSLPTMSFSHMLRSLIIHAFTLLLTLASLASPPFNLCDKQAATVITSLQLRNTFVQDKHADRRLLNSNSLLLHSSISTVIFFL